MPKLTTPRDTGHISFVGKRIAEARRAAGLTQKELAEQIGYSAAWLAEIERGRNTVNSYALLQLTKALGYPADFFVNPAYRYDRLAPKGPFEWRRMYPDEPDRADAHEAVDRAFLRE